MLLLEPVERDAIAPAYGALDHVGGRQCEYRGVTDPGDDGVEVRNYHEPPVGIGLGSLELFGVDVGRIREASVRAKQGLSPSLDLDGVRRSTVRWIAEQIATLGVAAPAVRGCWLAASPRAISAWRATRSPPSHRRKHPLARPYDPRAAELSVQTSRQVASCRVSTQEMPRR